MKTTKKLPNFETKSPNENRTNPPYMKKAGLLTLILLLVCVSGIFGQDKEAAEVAYATVDVLVDNQGFSFSSLLRGILGMVILVGIAFIFSKNRKAINWRTVSIGLGIQLLLAIGILKVPFIRQVFTILGKLFNDLLEFTVAGSEFILGVNLMDIENPHVGYVFAFQILPTIIFFSALTSVLFYLGVFL